MSKISQLSQQLECVRQNESGMFEISEDVMCEVMALALRKGQDTELAEAEHVASVLEMIASIEADDIDGDSVDLRFELEGEDTGATVSLTEYSHRAAVVITRLLTIVDGAKSDAVTLEPVYQNVNSCLETSERTAAPRHFDDMAFDNFAFACKIKLANSRAKGRNGWNDRSLCSDEQLARMLVDHTLKGNAGTFEDVAIFAMMLHQRGANPVVVANEAERLRTCNKP
ncbi:hypothetical protein ACI0X9_003385 [Cronobacter turicensis]